MNDITRSENQSAYTPERRAFHEAGHVVLHRCFGDLAEIRFADILFDKETKRGGQVVLSPYPGEPSGFVGLILGTLGGRAAEFLFYRDGDYRGCVDDIDEAGKLYLRLTRALRIESPEESLRRFLEACLETASEILDSRWSCVEKVASALLLKEKIERPEIIELTVDCHPDEYIHYARTLFDMLIPPE